MNLLAPMGLAYGGIVAARNLLYDRRLLSTYPLGRPTISVGNLTVGGTGKTPLTRLIATILADEGLLPCILTRGYGRQKEKNRVLVCDQKQIFADAKTAGDEPIELARSLSGRAIIIADADRISAARFAIERFQPDVFILDDGYQHRKARRDLDLLLIDATNPFGNGFPLPAGILRENISAIARADAVIISRADLAENLSETECVIREYNRNSPVFHASATVSGLRQIGSDAVPDWHDILQTPAAAFCGIGNPESFRTLLERSGFTLRRFLAFADHYQYPPAGIDAIVKAGRESGADILLTTAKDAVKLNRSVFSFPCYQVEIAIEVNPAEDFRGLILSSLAGRHDRPNRMP